MDPVLVVDDEVDNLEAIKRLLRSTYEVTITDSPFEALKLVQTSEFHVIISDQRMPEMTGVELLEKVKSVSPSTTRILLTGYTDIESVIGAINRGNIYRYIAKPWDPDDLHLTLRQANEAYVLKKEIEEKNRALEKSNAELKRALSELLVLDKAKARFLSLVSHELNTPLTVLSSFIPLLVEQSPHLSGDLQQSIASISRASERFQEIVAEVLDFVRLESDTRLDLQELNLDEATMEATRALEAERAKKQVTVKLKSLPHPLARCDRDKMQTAIRHFLKDAILRSPDGGEVRVEIRREGGALIYSISRQGEEISEEALRPLEPSQDPMHHHRNLGLSLAICRTVMERHGGDMWLVSSTPQQTVAAFRIEGAPLPQ